MRRGALALVPLLLLPFSLAACGSKSSGTGAIAVSVDSAGRLLAVLALCPQQQLDWLELADKNTGTRTTIEPPDPSKVGSTVILTAPIIGDPRPEGALDLIDRSHEYTLRGQTVKVDDPKKVGSLQDVTFKLDAVLKNADLKKGSVFGWAPKSTTPAVQPKKDFTERTLDRC